MDAGGNGLKHRHLIPYWLRQMGGRDAGGSLQSEVVNRGHFPTESHPINPRRRRAIWFPHSAEPIITNPKSFPTLTLHSPPFDSNRRHHRPDWQSAPSRRRFRHFPRCFPLSPPSPLLPRPNKIKRRTFHNIHFPITIRCDRRIICLMIISIRSAPLFGKVKVCVCVCVCVWGHVDTHSSTCQTRTQ